MEKTTITYRALIGFLLFSAVACRDVNNLGSGFYVTYIDLPQLRGVYYNSQNVNAGISVKGVWFNDSIILYYGRPFITGTNNLDTTNTYFYLLRKREYQNDPNQIGSKGQIGPLNEAEIQKYTHLLQNSERIVW